MTRPKIIKVGRYTFLVLKSLIVTSIIINVDSRVLFFTMQTQARAFTDIFGTGYPIPVTVGYPGTRK